MLDTDPVNQGSEEKGNLSLREAVKTLKDKDILGSVSIFIIMEDKDKNIQQTFELQKIKMYYNGESYVVI